MDSAGPAAVLARFRRDFHGCLTARADEVFELADAVLCADGPVRDLAGLSLAPEHRRGHGALYDAVNCGRIDAGRLRRALAGLPLPRAADGRLMLAADVSNWLRPEAATSPDRLFCHVYGRGKGQAQMIPGWPYSVIAALEPGRTSWTAVLDAVRLGPDDDDIAVTAAQARDVITRLIDAGHWRPGDPDILIVFDAGYDAARLAHLLADLPAQVLARFRSDRVMQLATPPRQPHARGRPRKHGGQLALSDPATWPAPQVTTSTLTSWYGTAVAAAWDQTDLVLRAGDVRAGGAAGQRISGQNLPGRPKTDKLDAMWLARLSEMGLLRASFVPQGDPGPARLHPCPDSAGSRAQPVLAAAGLHCSVAFRYRPSASGSAMISRSPGRWRRWITALSVRVQAADPVTLRKRDDRVPGMINCVGD